MATKDTSVKEGAGKDSSSFQDVIAPTQSKLPKPYHLFLITVASLIITEGFFMMFVLPGLGGSSIKMGAAINMVFDGIVLSPIIYYALFRPLISHIRAQHNVENSLRESGDKLGILVKELEQRNQEFSLINKTDDLLRGCRIAEEVYAIVAQSVKQISPDNSGGLFLLNPPGNILASAVLWGDTPSNNELVLTPEDCWALRQGQTYLVEDRGLGPACHHASSLSKGYICVPMMAQNEIIGVFHLYDRQRVITESMQRIAITMAGHIALTLSNLRLNENLRNQSIRDPLTGLFNRRYMEKTLERELFRLARKELPLGLIMIDIDHFKHFNDAFGHDAGDTALRELTILMQKYIRREDVVCRYGGEEFVVIMPEAPLEITRERAEKLCEGAKHLNIVHRGQPLGIITLSLGVAEFPKHGSTADVLLKTADTALYSAKKEGRNRVVVSSG